MQPGTPIPCPAFPSSGFALLPESEEAGRYDVTVFRGARFTLPVQYPTANRVYRAISAVMATAPVRLTVMAHGLPEGWPFSVTGLVGPVSLNSAPETKAYVAHVVDADTIEINAVNGAGLPAYVSGGYVEYFEPMALAGDTGRVLVREHPNAAPVLTLDAVSDLATVGRVTVDDATKRIDIEIAEERTAQFDRAVYTWSLAVIDATGDATVLLYGNLRVQAA